MLFSLCCSMAVMAQQTPVQATSPTTMKWMQINTDNFRILFPENFNDQAQRVANTLEHIREPEGKSLGITPRKMPIILHNQSAISNGFVAQAPWRSEFFTTPSQNYNFIGTNDWLTMLASHEYRHMVQFQKSRTGVGRIAYYLFGQLAQSGLAFLTVPQWFWEGDAVAIETAFTHSGRGRIPQFDLLLRTNLLEGRPFNYNKQYLRSYRHNIPNHYVLGYHMVSFLRKKTGNSHVWSNITQRAWGLPLPFAFSSAIKKETGLYVQDLYKEMILDLKKEWLKQQENITPTAFKKVNKRKSDVYTNYSYPQPLNDSSLLTLKSGIGDIPTLVTISSDGKEHKRFVPGLINSTGMLSVAQNKVIWNEYRYDPRWNVRSYAMIKVYDLSSKKLQVIGRHAKYTSASLAPNAQKIVAVEANSQYKTLLVILDCTTEAKKEIINPSNHFITMPRWSDDGQYILFISRSEDGKSIMRYHVESEKIETLLTTGTENVGHPVQHGNYLLYNSPVSGIDNIYAFNLIDKTQMQVTSSKYGAYNPAVSPDGKVIYYNEQTKNGLDIVKVPFAPSTWKLIEKVKNPALGIYSEMLTLQEKHPNLMQSIPSKKYSTKRYRRVQGIINPHTWGVYTNSSFSTIDIGVSLKDVLSTTVIDLGYRYSIAEQVGFWRAGLSYQGLYPIFDLEFTYGHRSATEFYNNTTETAKSIKFDWTELSAETGLRIPLLIAQSKYISNLSVGNFVGLTKVVSFKNSENGGGRFIPTSGTEGILFRSYIDNGSLIYNNFNTQMSHLLKQSRRDIFSRWGQSLTIDLLSTYPGSDYVGNQFSALLILYFPGLFPHHSFWGYGAYQYTQIEQKLDNYLFRNQAPTPRGHNIFRFQNYYITSANYTLPILYPDLALGPIINFQRVWGTVFLDYARGSTKSLNSTGTYTSIGGELRFDINIMRLLYKINLGVRYSYTIEKGGSSVEFIVGRIGFL